ncbi:hypothetical protein CDG77_05175 [Nostoc sp. 'Peltigera membranacea cyanobiont' 213]|nr:hypothetical protein CDG77_05175 [Nostoc sp. 'Peltigera membranacea cyanobiont' 213]
MLGRFAEHSVIRTLPQSSFLARLYPKLRTRFSFSSENPGFLAKTFSMSQIMDEVKKVKLMSHKGFSLGDRVAKQMDLELCKKMVGYHEYIFSQVQKS